MTARLGGYSKGMLQRIGLAQALVQEPELVILDEPTAGVDPLGSRQIRDLILTLKERGITVFLCSHLLEQVQEVCDHIGIIHRGRLIREGTLDSMLAVESQTEVVLEDAPPELLAEIEKLARNDPKASLVSSGNPRTTLERIFLEETRSADAENE